MTRLAHAIITLGLVCCVADNNNAPPLWKVYGDWEKGLKSLDHYSCLGTPWLSSVDSDQNDYVHVYLCTCWYEIPSCDGDMDFPQDKPVQVLALTHNHAESCGETKCRAWVATQPLTKFGEFTCKEPPIETIPKWDGLGAAPMPELPPLPEWFHPRVFRSSCP